MPVDTFGPQSFDIGEPLSAFVDRIVEEANEKRKKQEQGLLEELASKANSSAIQTFKPLIGLEAVEMPAPIETKKPLAAKVTDREYPVKSAKKSREQAQRNLEFLAKQIGFLETVPPQTINLEGFKKERARLLAEFEEQYPSNPTDIGRRAGI